MVRQSLWIFILVVLWAGIFPHPAHAASWWEFFFPVVEQGPDPSKTLKAPFADPDAVIEGEVTSGISGLPDNATPLNMRHRTNSDIAKWVEGTISDLLSYKAAEYQDEYKAKARSFVSAGLTEYIKFLEEMGIWRTLTTGQYDVHVFVKDVPILINEGAVDGRYRWLYQAKVALTYTPAGLKTYKDDKNATEKTMDILLNVQVGRVRGAQNEHGLMVESWDGKLQRVTK